MLLPAESCVRRVLQMIFYGAGNIGDDKHPEMELCPLTRMKRKVFGLGLVCLGIPSAHRAIHININLTDIY